MTGEHEAVSTGIAARVASARKYLVAVLGLVAEVVASGALHGTAETVAVAVLGAATASGVYVVPNARKGA